MGKFDDMNSEELTDLEKELVARLKRAEELLTEYHPV